MATMRETPLWKRRAHVAAFAIGVPFGPLVLIPLQKVIDVFSLETIPEQQSMLQYGGFAVLFWCWVVGVISQFLGATIAKRKWAAPRALYSTLSGAIYSSVVFAFSVFVLMAPGTAGVRFFVTWILLFPGAAIIFWAWLNQQLAPK